jgi:hypothetical protein
MLCPGRTGRMRAGRVGMVERADRGVWAELGGLGTGHREGKLVHVEPYRAGGGRVVALMMGEIIVADLVCTLQRSGTVARTSDKSRRKLIMYGRRRATSHSIPCCLDGVPVTATLLVGVLMG